MGFDLLISRRSIRAYTDQPVSEELVNDLLRAAMAAPSAGNQQPWHFVVIRDKNSLKKISEIHPHGAMVKQANVAILVCGDEAEEVHKGFWVQDCSAATQNLLLAAHAKGLGAVWVAIYPREERVEAFRKLFELPENIIPLSLIPIGYPAQSLPPANRIKTNRIHHERWSGEK